LNLPKPTSLEWLRELIDMTITARSNDFAVRRIERDANALLDKRAERPEMCWLILAFTAFLQGDRDECVRRVEAAYALAKHDAMVVGNAASLLGNMGEARLAALYAERLTALAPDDPKLALHAARVMCAALDLEGAARIMHLPVVRQALDDHELLLERDAILWNIDEAVGIFARAGVDADLRMQLLETAVAAVRSEEQAIRQVRPVFYVEDCTMRYELFLEDTSHRCADVTFAITAALVDGFDDDHPEQITFACRPLSSYRAMNEPAEVLQ
jgi:hypothetical protein